MIDKARTNLHIAYQHTSHGTHVSRGLFGLPDYKDGDYDINVVMWSWCNIAGHQVATNYLPGMDDLIAEYGEGGTKIGTGPGKGQNPVTFIFMTGHANKGYNTGDGNPKNQAGLIIQHCSNNGYYCLDYYSIDTYDMGDSYWEDAGDNGNSDTYAMWWILARIAGWDGS